MTPAIKLFKIPQSQVYAQHLQNIAHICKVSKESFFFLFLDHKENGMFNDVVNNYAFIKFKIIFFYRIMFASGHFISCYLSISYTIFSKRFLLRYNVCVFFPIFNITFSHVIEILLEINGHYGESRSLKLSELILMTCIKLHISQNY